MGHGGLNRAVTEQLRWSFPAWKVRGFALSNTHEALLGEGLEAPIPSVYVVVYYDHHGRTL